ncbi:Zinc finger protein MAGPIE [Apostasia shenzhenica]|uniref:Protein EARLY HEADING DATE 2 n=1 Tax=Apostasia shenzhenica TaxID=1088818 RepID=A0A2I0ALM7_9ASPA|nr:Zinc finger protein MAGPIE [Apostasia shenzhenica]
MVKGFIVPQQHQQVKESMQNLASASGKASVSSSEETPNPSRNPPASLKRKRSLPGNPDPDSEVVALSPTTLMATNRFVCEICNKGFQRDQNLQLHRRGHNLPWKLKQRANKEVKKKVYVCPEVTCVHHHPSRALGDLTGIKKHFSRKHGEKKWKCDKCSKKYAVQSDWKAHSKICGTREYRCDCGAIFSRRDSFITHRAFCDVLAEDGARTMAAGNSFASLASSSLPIQAQIPPLLTTVKDHQYYEPIKKENHQQYPFCSSAPEMPPPWHGAGHYGITNSSVASLNHLGSPDVSHFQMAVPPPPPPPPQMSATALLQKAAQMGSTASRSPPLISRMFGNGINVSRDNPLGVQLTPVMGADGGGGGGGSTGKISLFRDEMLNSLAPCDSGFDFREGFGGVIRSQREKNGGGGGGGGGGGRNDNLAGLTRDFLGLTNPWSTDILNPADFAPYMPSSFEHEDKKQW